jgi:hypothetical protein
MSVIPCTEKGVSEASCSGGTSMVFLYFLGTSMVCYFKIKEEIRSLVLKHTNNRHRIRKF